MPTREFGFGKLTLACAVCRGSCHFLRAMEMLPLGLLMTSIRTLVGLTLDWEGGPGDRKHGDVVFLSDREEFESVPMLHNAVAGADGDGSRHCRGSA